MLGFINVKLSDTTPLVDIFKCHLKIIATCTAILRLSNESIGVKCNGPLVPGQLIAI